MKRENREEGKKTTKRKKIRREEGEEEIKSKAKHTSIHVGYQ